jgi:hypothetical protein
VTMRRARSILTRSLPVLVAVALIAVACSGSPDPSPAPTSGGQSSPRPSSTGTLTILSPTNGQVVRAGDPVILRVELKDATLVKITSTDLKPNEGHLHVILDDSLVSMTSGLETVIPNLPAGRHLIKVEFVANDHAPFDPRVIAAVAFRVKS